MSPSTKPRLSDILSLSASKKLAFIFDFDGTLADLKDDPATVTLPRETIEDINQLSKNHSTIILSGRSLADLESIFGSELPLAGEHGLTSNFFQIAGHIEENIPEQAMTYLQNLVDRHPGSFLEAKSKSWVWHYRKIQNSIPSGLAESYQKELNRILLLQNSKFHCSLLDCVLEVKLADFSKKRFIEELRKGPLADHFILAFGDDASEEEAFASLGKESLVFAVGNRISNATHRFQKPAELRSWLNS